MIPRHPEPTTTSTTTSSSTTTSCPSGGSSRSTARSSSRFVYWYGRRLDAIASPGQAYQSDVAVEHAAEAERARARGTIDDAMLSAIAQGPGDARPGQGRLRLHLRAVPQARRRRQHRPEPDRRVLDPRQQADRHLQDGHRGRARQGDADVGSGARRAARRGGRRVRRLDREHQRARGARRRRASSRRGSRGQRPPARSPTRPS